MIKGAQSIKKIKARHHRTWSNQVGTEQTAPPLCWFAFILLGGIVRASGVGGVINSHTQV